VDHKSDDPCFHKEYTEAGVMTFVVDCTSEGYEEPGGGLKRFGSVLSFLFDTLFSFSQR